MPGIYLIAILVSAAGIVAIDARLSLAFWRAPVRSAVAIVIGTVFFLVWDAVGIATGVFVKGGSALLLGIDLAPQLPIEEPFFLAFLCYLALVSSAWANRRLARRAGRGAGAATEGGGAR
ncbi:lycopene cyclase domain-containing protein [uncultured Microbacterium sp.]|uniref:lycopene cyclase domain-containing protein n=1 Tax=uncultured Microbacterium sp. TaxID=191216 RepID=UPI0035CA9AE8